MNWIKSNPFVAGLAAITVLLCGILYFFASKWGTRHSEAKAGFDVAFQAVSTSESIALYPTRENVAGKSKALAEHRQAIDDLSGLFSAHRPEAMENITPQAFTDRLIAAQQKVSAAFGTDTELPENFFLGFEGYRNELAQSDATGALLYQLEGISIALRKLADARPSALIKVYREAVVEENGGTHQPGAEDIARYFPFEITFRGSESSAREFLTALGSTESRYFVIRCLKIQNERDTPPRVADAKFEAPAAANAIIAPANPFGEDFFGVDDDAGDGAQEPAEEPEEEKKEEKTEEGVEEEAEEKAPGAPPAAEVDSSRILAQVLGSEELIVFVRFDIAMFLPAKELSKP